MIYYLALILLINAKASDAGFDFSFQLPRETPGLENFPREYDSILADRLTIVGLLKKDALALRFEDLLQRCTTYHWNDHLQGYFTKEGISLANIQYIRETKVSHLINQIPKYNFDTFLNAPIKSLIHQTAFFSLKNGTDDILDVVKRIYITDKKITSNIINFKEQHKDATYIQYDEEKAINKHMLPFIEILQFDQTQAFMNVFNITTNQLRYLANSNFNDLNKAMSRSIFNRLENNVAEINASHIKLLDIVGKIQLLYSSIYHWSLSCKGSENSGVPFLETTLDFISYQCFGVGFDKTGKSLFEIEESLATFIGTFDMKTATIIAGRPFKNVSLETAKTFIYKLVKGLEVIERAKALPYFEHARSTFTTWDTIKSTPIGEILENMQKLPWEVLSKAFGVSDSSTNTLKFIPFEKLVSIVNKGTKSTFLNNIKRLRTVSVDTIFSAIDGKIDQQTLRLAYQVGVLSMASKPLKRLKDIYSLNFLNNFSRSLFSLCEEMFGIRIEEFLQFFGLESSASRFFKKTSINQLALLLRIEGVIERKLERFSIQQIVDQIRPEWSFAEAMLDSPANYSKAGKGDLETVLQLSIPQIVDQYHNTIHSSQAFTSYIKVWSKSEEVARIVKEESLFSLARRLKIQVTELANMKVLDIILTTFYTTLGEPCDSSASQYCGPLRKCVPTKTGDRCQCESGYRYSGAKKCIDINECLVGNVTCDKNAKCIDKIGDFECKCNPGYTMAADGTTCLNDNECEKAKHTCHRHATCIDTDGSYHCACNIGYEGDGEDCKDVDECKNESHNCHYQAICTNEEGSFSCKCKPGYSGASGRYCLDINECERGTHNCQYNANCKNTQGGFECICRAPFVKYDDGIRCSECNRQNVVNCHADAMCLSGKCTCKDGYSGDGRTCRDINECRELIDVCGKGRCSNNKGGYECSCENGYSTTSQNKKCIDINECEQPNGHLLCNGTDETCTNTDGAYSCISAKSNVSEKIALGTAIPLIVVMFVGIFVIWFLHRRHQGKKELDQFDQKLRQMYVNEAFTRDDESQISGNSLRPIAPRGGKMSKKNAVGAKQRFMSIFKK